MHLLCSSGKTEDDNPATHFEIRMKDLVGEKHVGRRHLPPQDG
jgi:hypothetical protein